jgi:GNAT superfamily N-acetyltransferase
MMAAWEEATAWYPDRYSGAESIAHASDMIDRGWVTVASDGTPRGFIACNNGYVHALFVCPEAQNAGVGSQLVQSAQQSTDALTLWTFADNHAARAFYKRQGFAETGERAGTETHLPEITLEWRRTR